jgi:hypothetical protein
LWKRTFHCDFEIAFGSAFADIGHSRFTDDLNAECQRDFIDVGNHYLPESVECIATEGCVKPNFFLL